MGKKNKQLKQEAKKTIFQAFFSGLPYESTQDDLRQFLGTSDGIQNIKMPRYQDTNRCLGYAHIRFNDEEAYKNALGKNGNKIGNRYLTISPARGQKQINEKPAIPVGCKTLFVKGLPYQMTQQQLKKQFESAGMIKDIRMVRNWANKNFKGFAYVEYKDQSGLKKAINKYHNQIFQGRRLICDASVTASKKGYKKRNPNEQQEQQQNEE